MKKTPSTLWILVLITQLCLCTYSSIIIGSATTTCIQNERRALLVLKTSFTDLTGRLSSWKGSDCCNWAGVTCSFSTGHVLKLDLRNTHALPIYRSNVDDALRVPLGDDFNPYLFELVALEVNSSLLQLRYLDYLDLSGIYFQQSQIPKFFGSMPNLRYLNLSGASFSGTVPRQLGDLINLRVLDLSSRSGQYLTIEDFSWVAGLTYLKYLDMTGTNFSKASNLVHALNMLPSLSVLHLSECGLSPIHFSQNKVFSANLSTIQELDISGNNLKNTSLTFLEKMTGLRVLDISNCGLSFSLPSWSWVQNFKNLTHLNVALNAFNGIEDGVSTILYHLCSLNSLDMSFNTFLNQLLPFDENLSSCRENDLEFLSLTSTRLTGNFPDFISKFRKIKYLDLSNNSLHGPIPTTLAENFPLLRVLDLSFNEFNGVIPYSIGKLINIVRFDVSSNSLEGEVYDHIHLSNLSNLKVLSTSSNNLLTFVFKPDWVPPFQLKRMDMSSNKVNKFPRWLETQTILIELRLSNASISDSLPKWTQNSHLIQLDLSHNHITGPLLQNIGDIFPAMKSLDLSDNRINGTIPRSLCKMESLWSLDLSHNHITGPLLQNIGDIFPAMQILHLSDNRINGTIPSSLCKMKSLSSLYLSHNHITGPLLQKVSDIFPAMQSLFLSDNCINGTIPSSICKMESLLFLDLSKNMLSGDIPNCWGDIYLQLLNLASNNLTGIIPSSIGHLSELQWLQLNNNSLEGELPFSLRNCTQLVFLNLGENGFSGNLPSWIGENLSSLQLLRLRKNMFDGRIPQEICQLSYLSFLDLADNKLIGRIPHCFGNLSRMFNKVDYNYSWVDLDEVDVEVIVKGREYTYTKTLPLLVNMDLSLNSLVGIIPEEITNLAGLFSLNLSHNHLTGNIPKSIGKLESLESLDFSENKLSGNIPTAISDLTSLSHLNMARNNLSGKIPRGRQLETIDHDKPFIYADNPELCGEPLEKRCPGDQAAPTSSNNNAEEEEEKENLQETIWLYSSVTLGYATGFWGFIGVLVFKKDWRVAFFRFADEMRDWMYVRVAVGISRLQRKMMQRD